MPTFNSQVIYNYAGDVKGVPHQHLEDTKQVPTVDEFVTTIQNAEAAMAQKILQDNAESARLLSVINDTGLATLGGGATLADAIAQINKINGFLSTQLVDSGSNQ